MEKVTLQHIESKIVSEQYFHTAKSSVCFLKMENGFEVHGTSGVVKESTFDKEIGEKFAREDAVKKLWALEGYLLQQRFYEGGEFFAHKS